MRHQKKQNKLDRPKAAKDMLLRNLASSLIIYEKIETTYAKAKAVQPFVERLITSAKPKNLTSRRNIARVLPVKNAQLKLFEVLSEKYKNVSGGYTRIIPQGAREGDGAKMARLELV